MILDNDTEDRNVGLPHWHKRRDGKVNISHRYCLLRVINERPGKGREKGKGS